MTNIYNAIQNLYNMDKETWQEVLSEMYTLVNNTSLKFDTFEQKFLLHLGKEVTRELKKMYDDGSLASLINDVLLQDINEQLSNIVHYYIKNNETLDNISIVDNANFRVVNGEYSNNKEYVIKIQNKKNVVIDGTGTIKCATNGVLIEGCENITIKGIKFKRITQAKYGEIFYGINIVNSKNITIECNTCSGFVDGIRATNSSKVKIINNITEYCGEEGIIFGENTSGIADNNIVTKHLGDGILIKSANEVIIKNNKVYEPIDKGLTPYLYEEVITELNPGIPRPTRGGGIGTNVEHSTNLCRNITIENNIIKNTGYGIGTIGVYNCIINNNIIDHVYDVAISITNDKVYNQNNLSSENIIITNNEIIGLLNNNSTNVVKIKKSEGNEIYNLIFADNIVNCINDYVAHTGIYTNVSCKIENNIIDNFNVAIFSEALSPDIINNRIVGLSPKATTKRGIYTKGGVVNGNVLTTNDIIMNCQIFIEQATNLICSNNKIKYNGANGAIQMANCKWCTVNGNDFEFTDSGYPYGGSSFENGTIKVDGYYMSRTIPTEQGYQQDDVVLNVKGVLGNVYGWVNVGNTTESMFRPYGQRGYRSIKDVSTVTPFYQGEEIFDWYEKKYYKSVGTTSADWKPMTSE